MIIPETQEITEDNTDSSNATNTYEVIPETQDIADDVTNTSKNWDTIQQTSKRKRTNRK